MNLNHYLVEGIVSLLLCWPSIFVLTTKMKILIQAIPAGRGNHYVRSFIPSWMCCYERIQLSHSFNFISCNGLTVIAFVLLCTCWWFWPRCLASTIILINRCTHRNDAKAGSLNLLFPRKKWCKSKIWKTVPCTSAILNSLQVFINNPLQYNALL